MSAKKCRQKKKNYIDTLEKELSQYKALVSQYQNIISKNQSIENAFNILNQKEKEALAEREFTEEQISNIKNEYKNAQSWLKEELFIKYIQSVIPLEYKIFYKKFLKMETVENGDDIITADNAIKDKNALFGISPTEPANSDSEYNQFMTNFGIGQGSNEEHNDVNSYSPNLYSNSIYEYNQNYYGNNPYQYIRGNNNNYYYPYQMMNRKEESKDNFGKRKWNRGEE